MVAEGGVGNATVARAAVRFYAGSVVANVTLGASDRGNHTLVASFQGTRAAVEEETMARYRAAEAAAAAAGAADSSDAPAAAAIGVGVAVALLLLLAAVALLVYLNTRKRKHARVAPADAAGGVKVTAAPSPFVRRRTTNGTSLAKETGAVEALRSSRIKDTSSSSSSSLSVPAADGPGGAAPAVAEAPGADGQVVDLSSNQYRVGAGAGAGAGVLSGATADLSVGQSPRPATRDRVLIGELVSEGGSIGVRARGNTHRSQSVKSSGGKALPELREAQILRASDHFLSPEIRTQIGKGGINSVQELPKRPGSVSSARSLDSPPSTPGLGDSNTSAMLDAVLSGDPASATYRLRKKNLKAALAHESKRNKSPTPRERFKAQAQASHKGKGTGTGTAAGRGVRSESPALLVGSGGSSPLVGRHKTRTRVDPAAAVIASDNVVAPGSPRSRVRLLSAD